MTIRAAMAMMTTTTPARAKASARRGSVVSRRRVARANANAMRGTRRGMMSLARANHHRRRHRGDDARASERFDPLNLETGDDDDDDASRVSRLARDVGVVTLTVAMTAGTGTGEARAATTGTIDSFMAFSPVCPASDGVFRVGQRAAQNLAGDENIENYRPLINDVLIRVRTELCVLESFVRETAVPFVQEKGLGWVLPRTETSETYLAGVVFMLGANFILLGSTKVVAIMAIYHDLSLGLATRLIGSALGALGPANEKERRQQELNEIMDKQMEELKKLMKKTDLSKEKRAKETQAINEKYAEQLELLRGYQEEQTNSDDARGLSTVRQVAGAVAVPLKLYGTVSQKGRQVLEVFDTFCSRYFVAFTVTYIIVKTAHYTVFKEFP